MAECNWFLHCKELATKQVEHPTLGWVDICDKHLDWLSEDGYLNPTKCVPPLVARHALKIQAILEKEELT